LSVGENPNALIQGADGRKLGVMKKVILAVFALLALGIPLLGLADAATEAKTRAGRKRHSQARHHTRKSTVGAKRSQGARQGHRSRARVRAHSRKAAPTDRTPR
jgi:Ni/Co efflux regulator RcnB